MRSLGLCTLLSVLCLVSTTQAEEPKSFLVPYRLTLPKHVLIRAKINGKGPFNFILDTGAPAVFITEKVAEKAGVKMEKKGLSTFDRFEIEGGVVVANTKGRVEDLFQLEGMNGLGLGGVEIHGVIGYNVLARYRIEFDFTKDKLAWTQLDYEPMPPMNLGGKGGQGAQLEVMGQIMKALGGMMGKKANPDYILRGYLGLELTAADEVVSIKNVLPGSPAAIAGFKAGDRVMAFAKAELKPGETTPQFNERTVLNVEDVERFTRRVRPGDEVQLTIERGGVKKAILVKTGEGL